MYGADKERVGAGCKWTITQLRHYFHQSNIDDKMLWTRVIQIIILTVLIQAPQVPNSSGTFELFGFDIMIDDNLKPWLLEVNFSPALTADCPVDFLVKKPMLHDLIDLLSFHESDRYRDIQNVKANGGSFKSRSLTYSNRGNTVRNVPLMTSRNSPSRLPTIQSRTSAMVSSQSTMPEEGEAPSEDIVQIRPGCGLPSVQQATTYSRVESRSSSGCSSLGSDCYSERRISHSARVASSKVSVMYAVTDLVD